LVFINGADTKAAQTFTLAHELAHLWIGQSGVTDATIRQAPSRQTERWCNQVAAEFLVPLAVLRTDYQKSNQLDREVSRLSRRFKVSSLVILRRIHDAGFISKPVFAEAFDAELDRLRDRAKGSGGNFYLTQSVRASKRFTRALLASTLEGQTLYRDAMRLLGVSKVETLHKLGHSLSVENVLARSERKTGRSGSQN
jgi:Zn-dependent peptidase ImmA (M78 family)